MVTMNDWGMEVPSAKGARKTPYTEAELLAMHKAGETLSNIFAKAYRINNWGRAKVREVLFGRAY